MVFFIKFFFGRDMAYSSNRVQNFHHSTPTSNFQEKNRFFSKSALPNISSQLEYVQGHPWPSCVKRKPSVLPNPTWRLAGLTVSINAPAQHSRLLAGLSALFKIRLFPWLYAASIGKTVKCHGKKCVKNIYTKPKSFLKVP